MLAKGPSIRVAYVRTRRQIANDQSSEVTDEQPTLPTDDHLDQITDDQIAGELPEELQEWSRAVTDDKEYQEIRKTIQEDRRTFPSKLKLKVSIRECTVSKKGDVLFRGRRWVPNKPTLRTSIIQTTHDSLIAGHPGREGTYAFVARQFFWPGMARDVRTFTDNCDGCGSNKSWRTRRQGFLKLLLIPDRI